MKKTLIALVVLMTSSWAFANTLVYNVDYSQMKNMDETSLDICGYPQQVKMDAALPIGPTFISQIYSYGKVTTERIQATKGSVGGGNLAPAFSGDYREKVYIVKQVIEGAYKPGIYNRVQVNTYGSTAAPSGVIVNTELLNHRYSAELTEGAYCGDIYYKLQ